MFELFYPNTSLPPVAWFKTWDAFMDYAKSHNTTGMKIRRIGNGEKE